MLSSICVSRRVADAPREDTPREDGILGETRPPTTARTDHPRPGVRDADTSLTSVKALAVGGLALASVISGLSYLWQKLALEGLPPATLILCRNLVAIACTLVFMLARGGVAWRFSRAETGRLALLGIVAYALPLLVGIQGVKRSTSGNASILILLEPASILLCSRLLLGESVRRAQVAGVATGLVGALFASTSSRSCD